MRPWVIHAAWSCGIELWTRPGATARHDRCASTPSRGLRAASCITGIGWPHNHVMPGLPHRAGPRPARGCCLPVRPGPGGLVRIWLLRHPVTRGLEADHPGRRWHLRRGQRRTALFGERAGVIAGAPDLDHPRAGVVDAGDPAQAARWQLVPRVGVPDGRGELLPAERLIPFELDKRAKRHPSPPRPAPAATATLPGGDPDAATGVAG